MKSVALILLCGILAGGGAVGDEPLAPHEVGPGVFAHGSSARLQSANIGWIIHNGQGWIVGAPHPELVQRALDEIKRMTGHGPAGLILTGADQIDAMPVLAAHKIMLVASHEQIAMIRKSSPGDKERSDPLAQMQVKPYENHLPLQAGQARVEVIELHQGDAAVWLPESRVLFAGGVCGNGPRAQLAGRDTARWIADLERLERLTEGSHARVVPGAGTFGPVEILRRQRRMLMELRRQVAHLVAQGRPLDSILASVSIPPEWLVWMPYDHPTPEDIAHVYQEITVPLAPFGANGPPGQDGSPHALALIGDRPHDPAHLEAGLSLAFAAAGVTPHFAYDVRSLSAANLEHVQLLVMLRDGMLWPQGGDQPTVGWMTPEQETAIVRFVESGRALLALHNSTGLYPENGPYLKLVGGTYQGHGPLERFRVDVVDTRHPITRGVSAYEIADEQHTPTPDLSKVHILLSSRSDDGVKATAGWAYEAGRGRVAYLANGHTRESLAHPMYQKLVQNALRWCLRKEEKQ